MRHLSAKCVTYTPIRFVETKGLGTYGKNSIKVKVVFVYIAQYPVRWTAQSALHFFCLPWQTCSFRHQLGFSGKHSSDAAIMRKD